MTRLVMRVVPFRELIAEKRSLFSSGAVGTELLREQERKSVYQPTWPERFKDRHLAVVAEWSGGCVYCGESEGIISTLPGSDGRLELPLCRRHVRWAMASRRERMGKQARNLKLLVLAWCRLRGGDPDLAKEWLGY